MTNIVPFPKKPCFLAPSREGPIPLYEFTNEELGRLCRWYSAMRYAFPRVQGVMVVCHDEKVSAIGLYGEGGTTPNCLLSKHEADGRTYLLWATDQDSPRVIASLSEITDAQIIAIAPPRNEASWLDAGGWMKVFTNRTIAGVMRGEGFSPSSA